MTYRPNTTIDINIDTDTINTTTPTLPKAFARFKRPVTKSPVTQLSKQIAGMMLLASLTACQTMPNATSSKNQQNPTKSPQLTTAHDLLSYSMLHRFDQSYDYQKTTYYQVNNLYQTDDVEAKDNSVFVTFLSLFSGEHRFPKTRDISPQAAECEQQYTDRYRQLLDKQNTQPARLSDELPSDPELVTAQATYEACLAKADEDTQNAIKNKLGDTGEFTTIDSIIASQAPDDSYQTSVKKLTDYLNRIADSNQTDDTEQDNAETGNTDSERDAKNPLGVPPKKIKPTDAQNSDTQANDSTTADETDEATTSKDSKPVSLAKAMKNLRITPEQITVLNDAFLTPKTLQYQGSYNQATGQLSSVLLEKSDSRFSQSYKRVPMLLDFNEMSITFEPDAVLPMASFLSDKELPKNLAGKSIKFVLPENLKQNIPLPILKDSLFQAIGKAYGDIDEEKFTEIVIDDYGRSLNANRAVKIHLTTQDVGFIVGRTLKYWSQSLQTIRQQHPEYISDDSKFGATLDLLAAANRVYRADDLAKLAQFVEAIVPLSYNSFNYYYFNHQNQLIGYRKIRDYSSSLLSARGKSITTAKISYRTAQNPQNTHLYYQPKPADVIDGNALFEQITGEKKLQSEAQDARFGYSDGSEISETDNSLSDSDCSDNAISELESIAEKAARIADCSARYTESEPNNDGDNDVGEDEASIKSTPKNTTDDANNVAAKQQY